MHYKLVLALFFTLLACSQGNVERYSATFQADEIVTSVYYGSSFEIKIADYFSVTSPVFSTDNPHIKIDNIGGLSVNLALPNQFRKLPVQLFTVITQKSGKGIDPTIIIGLNGTILTYSCQLKQKEKKISCPPVPKAYKIPNIVSIHGDTDTGLTFLQFYDPATKLSSVRIVRGDKLTEALREVTLKEPCRKFILAPKYMQFLCVRRSGTSLDAYTYTADGKKATLEEFTAQGQHVNTIDDFVFDLPGSYINNGVIRSGSDLYFVRNEVVKTLADPFGKNTADFELYSVFPKLVLVSRKLNKIIQYDFSSIADIAPEGEYDLEGCVLQKDSQITVSPSNSFLYLTCKMPNNVRHVFVYDPTTKNLRQSIPSPAQSNNFFGFTFFDDQNPKTDAIISFNSKSLQADYIYKEPSLIGEARDTQPIADTNVDVIRFHITATSSINPAYTQTFKAKVVVIFPERPIRKLQNEVELKAKQVAKDTYAVDFSNHQLFRGAVHNLTVTKSSNDKAEFKYMSSTDFFSKTPIPKISADETIYDYHYLPIKPNGNSEKKENDGIFVLLTADSVSKTSYISTYSAIRDKDSIKFNEVKFIAKYTVARAYCSILTIVNIGEFSLDNLFGFVQCHDNGVLLYGLALANGTQVMKQPIATAEADIHYTFDDVFGHIVVYHNSFDETPNFIEFYQFYPLGQKYSNPVKAIKYSDLGMKTKTHRPSSYDLIVNNKSRTFELYSVAYDGTLVYCSVPYENQSQKGRINLKSSRKDFCTVKTISELLPKGYSVRIPAWNGLQIIKDYQYLSAIYTTKFQYSNGLKFILNAETYSAFMFETVHPHGEPSLGTEIKIVKGFADYFPDYKKLTFFNVDERYVVFAAQAGPDKNEFVYIVYDHTLNESNSNYYKGHYEGTTWPVPILEATCGKRYHSTDVGMAPTRMFQEDPSDYVRRFITLGADNTLIQYYLYKDHRIQIKGDWSTVKFKVTAKNDHFMDETIIKVSRPPVSVEFE